VLLKIKDRKIKDRRFISSHMGKILRIRFPDEGIEGELK